MKHLIRIYFLNLLSLYLVMQIISGIVLANGFQTMLLVGLGLTIASIIIKPILNILLLPLNLLTFGVFRGISSAISLYLITLVTPGFSLNHFFFPGLTTQWFTLPSLSLGGILALICFSLALTIIYSLLHWLFK